MGPLDTDKCGLVFVYVCVCVLQKLVSGFTQMQLTWLGKREKCRATNVELMFVYIWKCGFICIYAGSTWNSLSSIRVGCFFYLCNIF